MIKTKAEDITRIDSESGIIATLIHHPEFAYHSEHLLPNHFVNKENRYIYAAICDLTRRDIETIDPYNLMESLSSSDATRRFSDEITVDQLYELVEMSELIARHTLEEYLMLVSNVMDAAFRRDIYDKLKQCEAWCFDTSVEDVRERVYNAIDDVMTEYTSADEIPDFGSVVDGLWADVEAHQDGKEFGIPFKFPTLNEYVVIEPGELACVAATAKAGKSMFMLNEAVDLLQRGKSVMYIDSELSDRLFLCRLVSHLSGVEFRRVRSGNYTPEEGERIREQLQWVKQQKFVHLYLPIFTTDAIYTAVKRVDHRFDGLDVLIVDYFKSSGSEDAFATYQELGALTDLVKNKLAGAMNIAALAAAQLNNNGKLADSAKIVRNASTIMYMLDKTPEEMEADGPECGNKKLIVKFNRNGMQHADGEYLDLNFAGNFCSFDEAKQHIPVDPF